MPTTKSEAPISIEHPAKVMIECLCVKDRIENVKFDLPISRDTVLIVCLEVLCNITWL